MKSQRVNGGVQRCEDRKTEQCSVGNVFPTSPRRMESLSLKKPPMRVHISHRLSCQFQTAFLTSSSLTAVNLSNRFCRCFVPAVKTSAGSVSSFSVVTNLFRIHYRSQEERKATRSLSGPSRTGVKRPSDLLRVRLPLSSEVKLTTWAEFVFHH